MDAVDAARWQFAIVTVYHFIFVPLTIGLSPLVAIMQTAWLVTGKDHWLRLTKFFGKLLLVNFAIGVATGIVQEFQFGMNWSEYSRFVGDIFGAPLAIEGLAAFFVESTFLGLWIFGWDRLPRLLHLASIWLVALATNLSAFFILAANSWMQHPVGAIYNPETGRAELDDFGAVLLNNTLWAAYTHTIATALLVAGTFVTGVAGWLMVREVRAGRVDLARAVYRPAALIGLVTIVASGAGVAVSGDWQAKLMFEQQPMKMAAAEGLCETQTGAGFSILTVGDLSNSCEGVIHLIEVPGLTSYLATGDFAGEVQGVPELQEYMEERYGDTDAAGEPVSYSPNLALTYWSFRLMIGFAIFSAALAVAALYLLRRKGAVTGNRWFARLCLVAIPMPFVAASFGWIFTETGRQPWVVVPNPTGVDMVRMLTSDGVSGVVGLGKVITSLAVFTLIYGVLAVVWVKLMSRYASHGAVEVAPPPDPEDADSDRPLSFAY
ncbi:MAG TPA: cytochrome ubiquinol oxidase subunit I [Actinotalea caeni]|uniref:cytochrome ubiquinol oxidase subunit I n=1 Tax=Actinotalea caeni TaxID=1348467 RepID=UPI0012E2B0A1|nr:cytochrome ubiquinol oxidase subunit I [Actinotalea caeni]HLV55737.1 cytochrome ubiquinol oxidase subunit I [Actinotalea caeni]